MSLVESWPSTEMRSNERLTQTPSSRSAVSGASAASVWTKHSIVANAGEIIPAPLAWAAQPDGARRQRDLERRALGEPVGRRDRLGERLVAVGGELGARGRDARGSPCRCRAGRRSRRSRRPPRGPRARRRPSPPAPCMRAASSSPRRPVAALALPELATTARMPVSSQRSCVSRTGAARTPERVKRAALTRLRGVGDEQPEIARPGGLEPARHPGRAEARGQAAGDLGDVLGDARSSATSQPLPLVAAEHQVQVLHGLRRRPLPQVVDRREHDQAAVRSSAWTEMRQKFVSRTSCMPGGPSTTSTHGSSP